MDALPLRRDEAAISAGDPPPAAIDISAGDHPRSSWLPQWGIFSFNGGPVPENGHETALELFSGANFGYVLQLGQAIDWPHNDLVRWLPFFSESFCLVSNRCRGSASYGPPLFRTCVRTNVQKACVFGQRTRPAFSAEPRPAGPRRNVQGWTCRLGVADPAVAPLVSASTYSMLIESSPRVTWIVQAFRAVVEARWLEPHLWVSAMVIYFVVVLW